ncbi:MAG: IS21 family transposase [Marinovum sp.]|nr:IS21 family transposase [Gammaproteobacteria bacterium]MBT6096842.1 IS21 family transposase [Marinovum sp.]MBT6792584.1 IS21 family transposase [Gammaproteobacteria bacterium]
MELYLRVRRAHFQGGLSGRKISHDFGISRDSVSKMLAYSEPPGYRRTVPIKSPKLDPYMDQIDQWLSEDKARPRKQRHTAKRIFERLRDECGFAGGYTIIKDYVRRKKRGNKEMFVPLSHPAGHGQADFGEALVVIGGIEQKAYFFALDLPHSDACYIRAYPAANTEAWLDGHVHAFAFFGAVPQSILYDNDKCLVARIMPDKTRKRTQRFSAMLSHYVIDDRYGRPGKGNDKGKVEGLVGYARRNFMVPMPRFADWGTFNDYLEEQCRKRQGDVLRGHKTSIGERLEADLVSMQDLPAAPFEACDLQSGQVTSTSVVRYRGNDYSVPVAFGHREVWIKGFVSRVVIGCAAEVIADHPRSYDAADMVFDPVHYLRLIERKIMAFDQAAPLQGWDLPETFVTLQRLLEARQGKAGKREYVQVLRLLERFEMDILHIAIKDALHLGAISFDAIKHLVLCRVERRPPRLDLDVYPFLPSTNVATTSAASYMSLLTGGEA